MGDEVGRVKSTSIFVERGLFGPRTMTLTVTDIHVVKRLLNLVFMDHEVLKVRCPLQTV